MRAVILLIVMNSFSFWVSAENLCNKAQIRGEGHWPIPENKFNASNAFKAQEKLNSLLENIKQQNGPLTIKNSIGLYSEVKNELIMIEGYILRSQAIDSTGNNAVGFQEAWCEFFETQAFVRH